MNCKSLFAFVFTVVAFSARAETTAIINGTIHTLGAAGTIQGASVIFENGFITAVGTGLSAPAGAKVIDAKGAEVTPGLMNSLTYLGLLEIAQEKSTDDTTAEKSDISAAFDVSYGINPAAVAIPVTRAHGITRAITVPIPSTTIFSGLGATISLGEGASFWVKPRIALFASLDERGAKIGGGARGTAWMFLRRALDDARFYQANRRDYDRGQSRSTVLPRADLEAIIPVLERKLPLVLRVYRESDIRQAIALAADYKVRVILLSASEGWKAADALAKAGIAVIADPLDNLPSRFETLSASLENVPKLMAAGVKVAFAATGEALENRYGILAQYAGIAVANGISRDQALAAITKNPAEIWGMSDTYGTLEKGKDADIVIWSGDPLELASVPTALFIRGQAQNLSSRQSKLRDRYKNIKSGEPPFGYR